MTKFPHLLLLLLAALWGQHVELSGPGVEPTQPRVEAQSLNPWPIREVPH